MIIYNVTINVDWSIHDEWLQWMKQEHIPNVMATHYFQRYQMVRLLMIDETDGPTYAVQYYLDSLETYNEYITTVAINQQQQSNNRWGALLVDFSTLMQIVH